MQSNFGRFPVESRVKLCATYWINIMKTNNVEMNAVEKPDIKSELVFPNEALAICCLRIFEMKVWSAFAARGTANACTPLAQNECTPTLPSRHRCEHVHFVKPTHVDTLVWSSLGTAVEIKHVATRCSKQKRYVFVDVVLATNKGRQLSWHYHWVVSVIWECLSGRRWSWWVILRTDVVVMSCRRKVNESSRSKCYVLLSYDAFFW